MAGLLIQMEMDDLQRFIDAQEADFTIALAEIKNGRKRSHWMWYIFPQLRGLGSSDNAMYYGIQNIDEAEEYINHPVLGQRLMEICLALLQLKSNNANEIFGSPDDLKLRSSMTLFASLPDAYPVFQSVLEKFFNGEPDDKTLRLIGEA
ncbi:MAG: calpastatin [Mucilaginibacter sp.]|nr:calpastatin [Mucilaginibacter sp.]